MTVINLMSNVHLEKIWVLSGGGVVSEFGHPQTRGGGGSKKDKFLRTSFMDGPLDLYMNVTRIKSLTFRYKGTMGRMHKQGILFLKGFPLF